MTPAEEVNERIIIAHFLGMEGGTKRNIWGAYDLYMAYNGTLEFSGFAPITGKQEILDALFPDPDSDEGVTVIIPRLANIVCKDNFVFTERTDKYYDKDKNLLATIKASGTMEMNAGKIKRWSDYGDLRPLADIFGLEMT